MGTLLIALCVYFPVLSIGGYLVSWKAIPLYRGDGGDNEAGIMAFVASGCAFLLSATIDMFLDTILHSLPMEILIVEAAIISAHIVTFTLTGDVRPVYANREEKVRREREIAEGEHLRILTNAIQEHERAIERQTAAVIERHRILRTNHERSMAHWDGRMGIEVIPHAAYIRDGELWVASQGEFFWNEGKVESTVDPDIFLASNSTLMKIGEGR